MDILEEISHGDSDDDLEEETFQIEEFEEQKKKDSQKETPLSQNSVELVALAKDGDIDPVIGREKEIKRVIEILARRKKNNPILLGETGVGKTAIAEGLALEIANEKCT